MHKSIATIDAPEFINLKPLDINPLMSSCEIKVLYLGENRNQSFINKEVATEMAKTLRGAPIVGYWKEDKKDFADHGNRMILDDEGIKFECLTKPYGFVAPDAKVWFQNFEDTDDFGNKVVREYLMTTGYLWTGQFEECKVAVEGEGRPHSMELDEETLKGHWANNPNNGMDFFIINDAIFSKLCILGEDVEPCFEGSSVTSQKVSSSFTKIDEDFKKTLFTMMQELQFALQGGQQMEDETIVSAEVVETPPVENEDNVSVAVEEVVEPTPAPAAEETPAISEEEIAATAEVQEEASEGAVDTGSEFAKKDDEDKDDEEDQADEPKDEDSDTQPKDSEEEPKDDEDEDEDEDKKKFELLQANHEALQAEFTALKEQYAALEEKCTELTAFKLAVEDAEKDAMIAKFSILSEEDKKDVIENKSKYSLDEIEAKLSVICVRKKVSFDLDDTTKNDIKTEEPDVTTFSLNNTGSSVPDWIMAVKNNTMNK